MHFDIEELDSSAFGAPVVRLNGVELDYDLKSCEQDYRERYNPCYAYTSIPAENLKNIHLFESNGFHFIDYQLRMEKQFTTIPDISHLQQLYYIKTVSPREDISAVLQLSDEIFQCDRIYVDPELPISIAQSRYHSFIVKSVTSKDEELITFHSYKNNELLGFHTHKVKDSSEILQFLVGISKKWQHTGASTAFMDFLFHFFSSSGFQKIVTHISANNYQNMEFEFKKMNFKLNQAFCVLRKIYPAAPDHT